VDSVNTDLASATSGALVDISAVARMLGVAPVTLRRWDRSGKLPAVRIGARRKYSLADTRRLQKEGVK
jgi:DNA-binding transcriptional MerR regulator